MKKTTKWIIIILGSGVCLIGLALVAFNIWFHQAFRFPEESNKELFQNLSRLSSDEKMIKNFYLHKDTFQILVDNLLSAKADLGLYRITQHFAMPPRFDDLMKTRILKYREVMRELGLREVNARNDHAVFLESEYIPRFIKSYVFLTSNSAQYRVVDSLDSYKPADTTFREGYSAFRHIDGNWYLYLRCYAYDPFPM